MLTAHGDLEHAVDDPNWVPCLKNVNKKLNAFLFAFTTQTTIGKSARNHTEA